MRISIVVFSLPFKIINFIDKYNSYVVKVIRLKLVNILYYFRSLLYFGKNNYCPCCERYIRSFVPLNPNALGNAMCPKCGSLERHRQIWIYLKKRTDLFTKNLKLLHIGPELAYQRIFRKKTNIEYYDADLYSFSAKYKVDITNIPIKSNFFDVIICIHVLEHVPDDIKALQEFFRVLKHGGWALLDVPINYTLDQTLNDGLKLSPEQREKLYGQKDHMRYYGKDFIDRVRNVGFNVVADDYLNHLNSEIYRKCGLKQGALLYVCKKD